MDRQRYHARDCTAHGGEQGSRKADREVTQVLVIDRIELGEVDQVANIGKLDDDDAVLGQQRGHTGHEIVLFVEMVYDVVGDDEIGGPALRTELSGEARPEEVDDGLDPLLSRGRGGVLRRIDAEDVNASLFEILQHVAIVRGDLNHQVGGAEAAPVD